MRQANLNNAQDVYIEGFAPDYAFDYRCEGELRDELKRIGSVREIKFYPSYYIPPPTRPTPQTWPSTLLCD